MTSDEFLEKMSYFSISLNELQEESRQLESEIKKQLRRVKYE